MSNPYSPPKAPSEIPKNDTPYSKEYKRKKSATRPLGIVLIVVLFFVFAVASAALLMIEGENWWIVHAALSVLLAYWFRNLWWGDDRERKIAVFFGFFVAAITWLGNPEGAIQTWSISELTSFAEGCYCLLAACYLVYLRKHPFFKALPA